MAKSGLVLLALLPVLSAVLLTVSGHYGLALFLVCPLLLGYPAVRYTRPSTGLGAAGIGAAATAIPLLGAYALGLEGLICVLICSPLMIAFGALGGWVAFQNQRRGSRLPDAALLLLLPGGMAFDTTAQPPVYTVQTTIDIAAPPETVWRNVVSFGDLPEPTEWYFHTGLAYPTRTRIEGSGVGATRYCEFTTGPVVEPVEAWEEARLLRFRVTDTPAPMREWSPYAEVSPKHLHGYLVSKAGQFRLIPIAGNRTRLEGTSWYQHGLYPAEYWRLWSDAAIRRIHLRVLGHIRALAEADPRQPRVARASIDSGDTHPPVSADRNTASITAIFFTESSSGTGGGPPARIARENSSPWMVYWSHSTNSSTVLPPPNGSRPSSR